MFEFHGWAAVVYSDDVLENAEFLPNVLRKLRLYIAGSEVAHRFARFGEAENDLHSVTFSGRLESETPEILEIYDWIAKYAEASYGLLCIRTDEPDSVEPGEMRTYRLGRGKVEVLADPIFSPASAIERSSRAQLSELNADIESGSVRRLNPRSQPLGAQAEHIISVFPLASLWEGSARLNAEKLRRVYAAQVRSMLQTRPFRFVVARLDRPLNWVQASECLEFWKSEVSAHLAAENEPNPHDYLGNYCYVANEWQTATGEHIVALERHD